MRLDPSMSPDEMQLVLSALEAWEGSVVVHFDVSVSTEQCDRSSGSDSKGCVHVEWVDSAPLRAHCQSSGDVGCEVDFSTHGLSSNVYLARDYGLSEPHTLAEHEIGHALGLYHEPGCVMTQTNGAGTFQIVQKDIDQFDSFR